MPGGGARYGYVTIAGGAWVPTDVAGLIAWWDASNSGSITQSSGSVSQWNDLSGNGWHATQATGSLQPTTGTRTINSLNVLDFYASTPDLLGFASAPMAGKTAGHVFYVFADDADPPSDDAFSGAVMSAWGNASTDHEPYSDSTVYHGWGATARKTVGNPASALTTPRQIDISTASGAWGYNLDGASVFSTGTNTVGWTASPKFGGADPYYFDGRLAEVFMYDSVLTGTNLTNARNFLKTKWGTS